MKMNQKSFWIFGALGALLLAATILLPRPVLGAPASCSNSTVVAGVHPDVINLGISNNDARMIMAAFGEEKKIEDCSKLKTVYDQCLCIYKNCNDACTDNKCLNKCRDDYDQCDNPKKK
jgi:hypothetical protein